MHAGTKGMGSTLRQIMSAKDISFEMDEIITSAIEDEAARSQKTKVRVCFFPSTCNHFLLLTYDDS